MAAIVDTLVLRLLPLERRVEQLVAMLLIGEIAFLAFTGWYGVRRGDYLVGPCCGKLVHSMNHISI